MFHALKKHIYIYIAGKNCSVDTQNMYNMTNIETDTSGWDLGGRRQVAPSAETAPASLHSRRAQGSKTLPRAVWMGLV